MSKRTVLARFDIELIYIFLGKAATMISGESFLKDTQKFHCPWLRLLKNQHIGN